jgi:hypothetical protein
LAPLLAPPHGNWAICVGASGCVSALSVP